MKEKYLIPKNTATYQKLSCRVYMKRVTRIELATEAWEASVLPLNYTRSTLESITLFIKSNNY